MDTKAKLTVAGVVFTLGAILLMISALMDKVDSKD